MKVGPLAGLGMIDPNYQNLEPGYIWDACRGCGFPVLSFVLKNGKRTFTGRSIVDWERPIRARSEFGGYRVDGVKDPSYWHVECFERRPKLYGAMPGEKESEAYYDCRGERWERECLAEEEFYRSREQRDDRRML
jgi:hypothetical protein